MNKTLSVAEIDALTGRDRQKTRDRLANIDEFEAWQCCGQGYTAIGTETPGIGDIFTVYEEERGWLTGRKVRAQVDFINYFNNTYRAFVLPGCDAINIDPWKRKDLIHWNNRIVGKEYCTHVEPSTKDTTQKSEVPE